MGNVFIDLAKVYEDIQEPELAGMCYAIASQQGFKKQAGVMQNLGRGALSLIDKIPGGREWVTSAVVNALIDAAETAITGGAGGLAQFADDPITMAAARAWLKTPAGQTLMNKIWGKVEQAVGYTAKKTRTDIAQVATNQPAPPSVTPKGTVTLEDKTGTPIKKISAAKMAKMQKEAFMGAITNALGKGIKKIKSMIANIGQFIGREDIQEFINFVKEFKAKNAPQQPRLTAQIAQGIRQLVYAANQLDDMGNEKAAILLDAVVEQVIEATSAKRVITAAADPDAEPGFLHRAGDALQAGSAAMGGGLIAGGIGALGAGLKGENILKGGVESGVLSGVMAGITQGINLLQNALRPLGSKIPAIRQLSGILRGIAPAVAAIVGAGTAASKFMGKPNTEVSNQTSETTPEAVPEVTPQAAMGKNLLQKLPQNMLSQLATSVD